MPRKRTAEEPPREPQETEEPPTEAAEATPAEPAQEPVHLPRLWDFLAELGGRAADMENLHQVFKAIIKDLDDRGRPESARALEFPHAIMDVIMRDLHLLNVVLHLVLAGFPILSMPVDDREKIMRAMQQQAPTSGKNDG